MSSQPSEQDLLPAAINEAQAKAKQLHAESMKSLTSDMNLPGLDEALDRIVEESGHLPEIQTLVEFIRESKIGIVRPRSDRGRT